MSQVPEMQNVIPHVPEASSPRRASARTPESALLYCIAVVLLPLLAIPAFIGLGKSDYFLHHGASVWVRSNDAVFDMQDRDCDVLVFGDSTAMTGIDPEQVARRTGFKTCNIAVTNAVLAVTGNLTLDHFLQQNGHPKILIVQLSPDDFQQENRVWSHTIYPEGLLELLRHGTPEEARHALLANPREAVAFAGYAAGFSAYSVIKDVWFRTTHMRSEEDLVQLNTQGTFFTPPAPAREYCDTTTKLADNSHGGFSRELATDFRKSYADKSGVVLVDVAPIPSCDLNLAAYRDELNGVTSNKLDALPIRLFNDDRHFTADGSVEVSKRVARQVEQVALENPAIDDRVPAPRPVVVLRRVSLQR